MVHQISTFKEVHKLKQNFQENKIANGKTPFYVIGPFCTHHSICLNIGLAVLNGNDGFLMLVLSTKKHYLSFLKKIFVFQKICFKIKVLKMFKISIDCHIKICPSLKQRVILKSCSLKRVDFKTEPLRKNVFQC